MVTWCLTPTETIRLIRDWQKPRGAGAGGGEGIWRRGSEEDREGNYIPVATLSPPE